MMKEELKEVRFLYSGFSKNSGLSISSLSELAKMSKRNLI